MSRGEFFKEPTRERTWVSFGFRTMDEVIHLNDLGGKGFSMGPD